MASDNLSGVKIDRIWKVVLLPGLIIQWFGYMNPSRGQVIASTRRARSPIYTYLYATGFWGLLGVLGVISLRDDNQAELGETALALDVREAGASPLAQTEPAARGEEIELPAVVAEPALEELVPTVVPPTASACPEPYEDAPGGFCPGSHPDIEAAIAAALESGATTTWTTGGSSGYAVVSQARETGDRSCRNYFYTVNTESGTWQSAPQQACQQMASAAQ